MYHCVYIYHDHHTDHSMGLGVGVCLCVRERESDKDYIEVQNGRSYIARKYLVLVENGCRLQSSGVYIYRYVICIIYYTHI